MNRLLYQHHSSWGYTFIPELKTRVMHESGGYLLSTNQDGFRSVSNFVNKRGNPPRVLLFGDSFTAGMGVSDSVRYGDLVEATTGVEIFNLALPGTGTDQQYLVWKDFAHEIEHDLVILAVQVENIRRVNSRFRRVHDVFNQKIVLAKPYFELDAGGLTQPRHYPVPKAPLCEDNLSPADSPHVERGGRLEGMRNLINKMGPGVKQLIQRVAKPQPLPEYGSADRPEWQLMKAIIGQWCAEIRKPVLVYLLPFYTYVEGLADPSAYQSRFRELENEVGFKLVDPLPQLQSRTREERRHFRFKADIHPTRTMHAALAGVLGAEIKSVLNL